VFVFGYGFNDPNVLSIIEEIGDLISNDEGMIENIYYVRWDPDAEKRSDLQDETVIASNGRQFRVWAIVTNDFTWVFRALAQEQELKSINTKLVRALAARAYKLVRSEIPRGTVEVNYDILERVADQEEELPRLLGIVEATNTNMTHPFVLSQVAKRLGYPSWHGASNLLAKIKFDTGIDVRQTDNRYHCKIKTGRASEIRKWSASAIDLLRKVKQGESYEVHV
jgi:hypothetical protein